MPPSSVFVDRVVHLQGLKYSVCAELRVGRKKEKLFLEGDAVCPPKLGKRLFCQVKFKKKKGENCLINFLCNLHNALLGNNPSSFLAILIRVA